ncbi:MAG: PASTA domain-containing protein, partial [Phoenicibacter congonensis]|nr:PASTA domain-containing protein [Phoenicibacter congonensis]
MICPKCGTPNRASAKFCDECGYELPSVAPIASAMFDDEEHVATCIPKSAPTADLSGVDNTNDSSFVEVSDDEQSLSNEPETTEVNDEENSADESQAVSDSEDNQEFVPDDAEQVEEYPSDITAVFDPVEINAGDAHAVSDSEITARIGNIYDNDEYAGKTAQLEPLGFDPAEFSHLDADKTAEFAPVAESDKPASKAGSVSPKTYSANATQKKKGLDSIKKRNLIIGAVVVVLIAGLVGLTYALQLWGGKVIPDVCGLQEADAKAQIEACGFKVETEQIASDDVSGIVLSTEPGVGSRAEAGSTVTLQISVKRVIPNIVGMTKENAQRVMDKNGFTNVEYTTEKSDEDEGKVLSVSPEVDIRCKADARVTVVVAEPYRVPDVSGKTEEEAIDAIKEAGFKVTTTEAYDENSTEGTVLSVSPDVNSALKTGSEVQLTICIHRSTKLVQLAGQYFDNLNGEFT